jgi:hypothetical protein
VLLGRGDGTLQAAVPYRVGFSPRAVTAADFDGDGKVDLATANIDADSISVLAGNGDGTFRAATDYAVGSRPHAIVSGDFNGDGRIDLAAGNTGVSMSPTSVLLGAANGTFTPAINLPRAASGSSRENFNGDGRTDLAAASYGSYISVMLGKASTTAPLEAPVRYSVDVGAWAIAAADFNGDGKLDLATANQTSSTMSVFMGTGTGTFQPQTSYEVSMLGSSTALARGRRDHDRRPERRRRGRPRGQHAADQQQRLRVPQPLQAIGAARGCGRVRTNRAASLVPAAALTHI